jgi:HD superfamily phosphodiesterase
MNSKLINNLYNIAENACKAKSNKYGYGIWSHHIKPMVSIAQKLAKEFGADEEIVTIATLLHDLAGIQNSKDRDKHHIIVVQINSVLYCNQ